MPEYEIARDISIAAWSSQVAIAAIFALGLLALDANHRGEQVRAWRALFLFFIVSILPFVATTGVLPSLGRMLGTEPWEGIGQTTAMLLAYPVNILFTGFVVLRSGGANVSPFTPMLALYPSLAIFLRQPTTSVIFFAVLVGAVTTLAVMREPRYDIDTVMTRVASWIVAICALALATVVGLATAP